MVKLDSIQYLYESVYQLYTLKPKYHPKNLYYETAPQNLYCETHHNLLYPF